MGIHLATSRMIRIFFFEKQRVFKERYPALFYGFILLLGTLFILQTPFALIPFLLILRKKHFFISFILFLFPAAFVHQFYTFPTKEQDIEGIFLIHSIRKNERFGTGWSYQGILKTEQGRIPCHCFHKKFMTATQAYRIKGTITSSPRLLRNLSFGLSSSHLEEFAPQILGFHDEVNGHYPEHDIQWMSAQRVLSESAKHRGGQGPFTSHERTRDASKLPKYEGEKPKTQVSKYRLKIEGAWEKQAARITLVDLRYQAQETIKRYILKRIPEPRAAFFLTGILTGQLEDRVMQKEFSQLGLSHLMAISGLHFSLIALALLCILRLFLPPKWGAFFLMVGLTLYFLFIGPTPSVLRAWLMAMVFLGGQLLEKKTSALNSMGVAIVISLLIDPLSVCTLSFQLSYLATAGILFFYPFVDSLLQNWIPKKKLLEMVAQSRIQQLLYILSAILREGLSLSLSVHIPLLPFLLFIFHQFPLSSFFYNLFFPFLASLAIFLFLFSLILGPWMHRINGYYCDWILQMVESPPIIWKIISIQSMPSWTLTTLMTGILFFAIAMKIKKSRDCFSISDYSVVDHP